MFNPHHPPSLPYCCPQKNTLIDYAIHFWISFMLLILGCGALAMIVIAIIR